jgi:hypothetical protein
MKAYKTELSHFFSVKKEEDNQLKKMLAKKTFEEKKQIIEEHRASALLEKGTYTIEGQQFQRQQYIRDIHYLEQLKDKIRDKHLQFNKYKYDVMYELVEMKEEEYDRYDAELRELKRKRDEYISKKAAKQEQINVKIEQYKMNIKQLFELYNNPLTDVEDKKLIYKDISYYKQAIFNILKPHLGMVQIDKMKTVVTDYLPIKGNQRNIMNLDESMESVNISPVVLEPEVIEKSESNEETKSNESEEISKSRGYDSTNNMS